MDKSYLQRQAAWEILLKVSAGTYSDQALDRVLLNYKFSALDIAFITELAFGCIRYRRLLDLWIDHVSKINHQKQPPKLRWLLHIGIYQLLKMDRIPVSAAINTTVEIANSNNLKGLSGVVNGILRNTIRKVTSKNLPIISENEIEKISYIESLPLWLVKEMSNWFGIEKTHIIAKAFNKKPSIDLRINTLKTDVDSLLRDLEKKNIKAEKIRNLDNAVSLISKPRTINLLPGYENGEWVIQDRSSQWVAPLLNPQKGEKILDACAAPGSKTTHIAELTNDNSEIWAVDRSEKRLKILKSNLIRLNIKSVRLLKGDSTKLIELNPKFLKYFDKILIDAPCSGIGTFSRNPDSRWSISKEKILQLIVLQEKLLQNNLNLLKENGRIVYSTCTICPEENNILIREFLKKNNNLKLVYEKQIFPGLDSFGDGFYAAVICNK